MDMQTASETKACRLLQPGVDITVGRGRVIWVGATTKHPEGWILPGRTVTQNPYRAYSVAADIDAFTKQRL